MKKHLLLLHITIFACTNYDPEGVDTNLVGDSDRPAWNPDPQTISNDSSSQNSIAWSPPAEDYSVDHFLLRSVEAATNKETLVKVDGSKSDYTFEGLKADSEYTHYINACLNTECSDTIEIITNENDEENNYWTLKTSVEKWQFQQNSSRSNFQVMFLNAKDPSILTFENTNGFDGKAILSYTDINTGNIHFGDIDLIATEPDTPLVISSLPNNRIFGGAILSRFTSSQFKPFLRSEEVGLMIFLSFENSDESTHIAVISNDGGLTPSFGQEGACSPFDYPQCAIEFCLNSNNESILSISSFQVTWEYFGLENMGAEEIPSLVVEGFENINDEGSIYYVTMQDDGSWNFVSDENDHPKKWIRNAKNVSVVNYNRAESKLYYQSALNNELYLLYWHAGATGEEYVYDFDDLEDSSLARKIELVDSEGNPLPDTSAESIGNYHFFTNPIDQKQYMLFTVLQNGEAIGLGLSYLTNP